MVIAGRLQAMGWRGVFVLLAVAAGATAMVAACFLAIQFRTTRPAAGATAEIEVEEGMACTDRGSKRPPSRRRPDARPRV
jgi:hypothetical protein